MRNRKRGDRQVNSDEAMHAVSRRQSSRSAGAISLKMRSSTRCLLSKMKELASAEIQNRQQKGATIMNMKLEVVIVPVSNVDRAKAFYEKLGFRLDIDIVSESF